MKYALLGEFNLEQIDADMPNGGTTVLWVYAFIATIVMVNLLVAMFSDTCAAPLLRTGRVAGARTRRRPRACAGIVASRRSR